jgi:hypothetical protein
VKPDAKQPSKNASVRKTPDWTNDSATLPSGFVISVDVTNTMIASGTKITAIVRNCRFRYAQAPS